MTTNNQYYKQILEKLTGNSVTGNHSDNYYLKLICELYGYTYTGTKCNGRLIKEMASRVTGHTYTGNHFNNYYLRDIAEFLVDNTLGNHSDNFFLDIIYDNISLGSSITLGLSSNSVVIGGEVTLSALVLDSSRQPVEEATVTFKVDGVTLDSDDTDSTGVASVTYTTDTIGNISITAEYDNVSNTKTLTVNKHSSSISITSNNNSVVIGDTVTVSGNLLIDGVGASGLPVDIYNGDTKIADDVITTNGGAFTYTTGALNSASTVTFRAVFEADSTHNGSNNSTNVVVNKKTSVLNIDAPTITYKDAFSVTGSLTDSNNNPITGATVKLIWNDGSSHMATATTDSNGDVTFDRDAPTEITDYQFKLQYDGDSTYKNSESSNLTVTVQKETTVLTVTSPTNNSNIVNNETITITGTLKDNDTNHDYTELNGKQVLVKLGNNTLTTLTVDSNGEYTGSITGNQLNTGANTLTIEFVGDSHYTSSTQTVNITKYVYDDITLTEVDSKTILSYADTDTATFKAFLTNNGTNVSVPDQTVTMKVYKSSDDSLVDTLTVSSNVDGSYSGTYSSGGVGDVYVKAECNFVSEIYAIEDIYKYDPELLTSITYDLNVPATDFEIDMIVKRTSTTASWSAVIFDNLYRIGMPDSGGYIGICNHSNGQWITKSSSTTRQNVDLPLKITYVNGTCTITCDGQTITNSSLTTLQHIDSVVVASLSCTIHEFKVKAL